ncbi:hypothetical protein TrVGV298_003523 [Trichoderma virens]|nr:hypothetical protein TrVGV298_003523 [Trichoderma virens]
MVDTFPSIRVGLMVGIGGGIPSKVRLGDVVVSTPIGQFPGVVQWDSGKAKDGGGFERTGAMDNPPASLLTALSKLEMEYELGGSRIPKHLESMKAKWPALAAKYQRSDSLEDVVFNADYGHVNPDAENKGQENERCQLCDGNKAVRRTPTDPRVHYGLIASGNQVIKDAAFRDKLNESLGGSVLCIEMEAAGLINNFPCIVIRGICDYADSHKNKDWQEYAAAVAAAYAKELLESIPPNDVHGERRMTDIFGRALEAISATGGDVARIRSRLDKDETDRALNWLTPTDYAPQQSDYLARRQPGTGQWLLDSKEFQAWLGANNQTLFCPGMPGAGKTILTSIVVNELCTRFPDDPTIGIAYIYCNFRRKEEQKVSHMLASLLKQLSQSCPSLPTSVRDLYDQHRSKQTRPLPDEVSKALQSTAALYSRVFIIIDAFDEVPDSRRRRLLPELLYLQKHSFVNVFVTSRYIPEVTMQFLSNISLEIRANESDVKKYLEGHIRELSSFVGEDRQLQEEIKTVISEAVDGMFLLAQIYLDSLADKLTKNTIRSALHIIRTQGQRLAGDKNQVLDTAYDQTMDRINAQKKGFRELATKVLSWITCAKRPLTQSELQCALSISIENPRFDQGDLLSPKDIVSACAGLVTIDEESDVIRLVHYTTQEYFERTMAKWFPNADVSITETCIACLLCGEDSSRGEGFP